VANSAGHKVVGYGSSYTQGRTQDIRALPQLGVRAHLLPPLHRNEKRKIKAAYTISKAPTIGGLGKLPYEVYAEAGWTEDL
jgi:hypothetical protein